MPTKFPIKNISDLEKLSRQVRWQHFEKLVAFVFEENGFDIWEKKVIVFSDGTKRQFDVIAEKFGKVWLVECKKQKRLNVADALRKHEERCEKFAKALQKVVVPMIVALDDEKEGEIPVIPLLKLNNFINEYWDFKIR